MAPLALLPASAIAQTAAPQQDLVRHEVELDVGVEDAWAYFTEADKVGAWMAPVAAVDLRPGGSIRTHYDPCARIGDPGTITLRIVNYVPRRMLTLQSDLDVAREADWMNDTVYSARGNLFNLIEFHPEASGRTRLVSWGLGYGSGPAWDAMKAFFIDGNTWSYGQLRKAISGQTVWPACPDTQR
ncbi:SRPBCC family protein [Sphingomicrobium astaxanthinifaciens]|uniref:SRPBCC family protein n=1 Tax=Sphingomicrobium astaxanthinifaciens TaxID=1227949 RepID=UPI001FCC6B4E|nr:SRPBCC domain-containing protein [Sphingomicrobium astaxanthinifaciens]MCJ7422205.1 SRPBCC domain-containing protein [Sphingomicrobium astaxanthinifaciens]